MIFHKPESTDLKSRRKALVFDSFGRLLYHKAMTERALAFHLTGLLLSLGLFTSSCSSPGPLSTTASEGSSPERNISAAPEGILFDWPVDRARMTQGFFTNKRRPHLGIDLAASRGTPILASQSGIVIYRGRDFRGFGNMVMIESPGGWATLYAHLDRFHVSEGQKVAMGEIIGSMGRTGRATGVHLHFEIRKDKKPIDPLPYLPGGARLARK